MPVAMSCSASSKSAIASGSLRMASVSRALSGSLQSKIRVLLAQSAHVVDQVPAARFGHMTDRKPQPDMATGAPELVTARTSVGRCGLRSLLAGFFGFSRPAGWLRDNGRACGAGRRSRRHPNAQVSLDAGQTLTDLTELLQDGPLLMPEHGQHRHERRSKGRENNDVHFKPALQYQAARVSNPRRGLRKRRAAGMPIPRKPSMRAKRSFTSPRPARCSRSDASNLSQSLSVDRC